MICDMKNYHQFLGCGFHFYLSQYLKLFYKVISIDSKNLTQIQTYNLRGTLNKPSKKQKAKINNCCYCHSVTKSRLTLCDPVDYSTSGLPILYYLMSHELVMLSNHLILCCPLLFP